MQRPFNEIAPRQVPKLGSVCRGIAAVAFALDEIGCVERTDHDLAKHIVDADADVRALLDYALAKLAMEAAS